MATGRLRDSAALAEGLQRWLATLPAGDRPAEVGSAGDRPERDLPAGDPHEGAGSDGWAASFAGCTVAGVAHASEGWSNETLIVELSGPPGHDGRMVVRLPPVEPSFPEYDLGLQATVHQLVAGQGVPAPVPIHLERDEGFVGTPFLVMPFVVGRIPGQGPPFDPWIAGLGPDGQRRLHDRFVEVLAAIHRVDWSPAAGVLRGAGGLTGELDWWDRYLVWSGEPFPPIQQGLDWCRANRPAAEPPASLLWGDARLGNLVLDDDLGLRAVLDWEMALVGPAELDLGWYLALDGAMTELAGRSVPGFPPHAETLAAAGRLLGRPLVDMGWYEIFALVRSLAINNHQARMAASTGARYVSAPDGANPMVGVLERRIAATGS